MDVGLGELPGEVQEEVGVVWWLLSWLASSVMVFGGAVPYLPQYQEIQRSGSADGFSTRVCLVLLIANILRIFFWVGKQFEVTLLFQSLVMILTMLAMLHLCCSVQNNNRVSTRQHRISDLDVRYFWRWTVFEDYVLFCLAVCLLCGLVTMALLDWVAYVEALGSAALLTEAMLGLPQLLQNQQHRSTHGMSVGMVLLWTAGDLFKTAYFIINDSPAQFWVCGVVQILIDGCILLQVCYYGQDYRAKLG